MFKKEGNTRAFDLEERTANFGIAVIKFAKKLSLNQISSPLVSQLIRLATSIGANYLEAENAESKKDFIHKISISKKESKETKHWLRMLAGAIPETKVDARKLWTEAQELNLIFDSIVKKKKEQK